jgi:hypothetical protein
LKWFIHFTPSPLYRACYWAVECCSSCCHAQVLLPVRYWVGA